MEHRVCFITASNEPICHLIHVQNYSSTYPSKQQMHLHPVALKASIKFITRVQFICILSLTEYDKMFALLPNPRHKRPEQLYVNSHHINNNKSIVIFSFTRTKTHSRLFTKLFDLSLLLLSKRDSTV